MNKALKIFLSACCYFYMLSSWANDKFDILPDLPEPVIGAAQASSVTTTDTLNTVGVQSVGQEPNFISIIFSLLFVILLIYATGIIYTKLNKFGFNTLKKQMGDKASSQVAVISTTALGNNKTLHIVELDGKRMLIGASVNSIHLIKDLGEYPPTDIIESEYSKIEIPNIRIPKIEIPRIEIPGFTKVVCAKKQVQEESDQSDNDLNKKSEEFEISDIYEEESSDVVIDNLFKTTTQEDIEEKLPENKHKVDPDEFALYKKYLS